MEQQHTPHFLNPQSMGRWISFLAQDGRCRLWCRQFVGYEGIEDHTCSYLFFGERREDVAYALLDRPRVLSQCIPCEIFAGAAYHDFVSRHSEELEEDEDFRGFSVPGQQARFMEAIEREPPETVLEILCEHNTDNDAEGNFCQLVELSLANFPDVARCERLAHKRRRVLARTLANVRGLGGGAALVVASMIYPEGPPALLAVMLDERMELWQICASSAYCEAKSIFLAAPSHGSALRRFMAEESLAEVCEPIAAGTKLVPERAKRIQILGGMSDREISSMLCWAYQKGYFRTFCCCPVLAKRVLWWGNWKRKPSVLALLMRTNA